MSLYEICSDDLDQVEGAAQMQNEDEFCEDVAPATGHENLKDETMESTASRLFVL